MRFVSFFAGIGGIDLGLERADHECVGQVEIDPYALRVLEKHWPDVPRFGDIAKLDAGDLPESDLWAGGFPCQDISNAGKRAGIHGGRSGLFFDWMRLAFAVRPRYLLMENVGALINRGLSTVLGTLAEGGYDAEWDCISACAIGAPHPRERVFIVAYDANNGWKDGADRLARRCFKAGREDTSFRCVEWGQFAVAGSSCGVPRGHTLCRNPEYIRHQHWDIEPALGRVVDGLSLPSCELICLGNAVVPQVAEYIGRLLADLP